jgi:sporulation integral membrane protein YlbJ
MEKVKANFFIIPLKKYIVSIFSVIFMITLVLYSKSNLQAAKEGLFLWANNVVPSLFPFFVATEILCSTNVINVIGKILEKPVKKIFNVPGQGAVALCMGIISGYPTGAKIVSNFKENNICTKEEAERLLAFTNNSGPLFIIGTVGISLFGDVKIGYMLLLIHIISCIIVGLIFRNWKKYAVGSSNFSIIEKNKRTISFGDLGEIIGNSIKHSIVTILNIGGFVVIFSVIISILKSSGFFEIISNLFECFNLSGDLASAVISGILELTNGVFCIKNEFMFNFIYVRIWRNICIITGLEYCFKIKNFYKAIFLWKIITRNFSIYNYGNIFVKINDYDII